VNRTTTTRWHWRFLLVSSALALLSRCGLRADVDGKRYIESVHSFADRVLADGRDKYGEEKTPLFVDGLHVKTLEPARWQCRGQIWVLSNLASQQPLLRTLDGLIYWGGHLAWDLDREKSVGQYADAHELKGHQPYFRLMWRVDASRTKELMEMVWASHILDWSLLDYNRHGSVQKNLVPQWDHAFAEDVQVPFPAKGGNLSFVNVTPPLMHSAVMLAVLDNNPDVLKWGRRLIEAGGEYAEVGREFLQWASDDLKAYTQHCYDSKTGRERCKDRNRS